MKTQNNWEQRLEHWIKTQHGTAGWQIKLENLIRDELTSLARDLIGVIPEKDDGISFGVNTTMSEDRLMAKSYNTALSDTRTAQEKLIKERGLTLDK